MFAKKTYGADELLPPLTFKEWERGTSLKTISDIVDIGMGKTMFDWMPRDHLRFTKRTYKR